MWKTILFAGGLLIWALSPGVDGAERVVFLATHESPPYSGSSLKNKGILPEIVSLAYERAGYRAEIVVVPWKRGLEETKTGGYDGLLGCWYRKERERWFVYSDPLIASEMIFLQRRGEGILFDGDCTSLKPYRIGYIRGYALPSGIEPFKELLTIERVTNYRQNLEKLKRGRLDLVIVDRLLSRYLILFEKKRFAGLFEEIDYILARDMNHLVFSRRKSDHMILVAAFNRGLKALKDDGTIGKILKRHGVGWCEERTIEKREAVNSR